MLTYVAFIKQTCQVANSAETRGQRNAALLKAHPELKKSLTPTQRSSCFRLRRNSRVYVQRRFATHALAFVQFRFRKHSIYITHQRYEDAEDAIVLERESSSSALVLKAVPNLSTFIAGK